MNPVRVQKVKLSSEGLTEFRRLFLWLSRTNQKVHGYYQEHSRLTWHK